MFGLSVSRSTRSNFNLRSSTEDANVIKNQPDDDQMEFEEEKTVYEPIYKLNIAKAYT